ncbi:hypothetical protein KHA90_24290 [Flavobacterium psychroterrae]|uniref:Uncharacterized protein n=1 Tax=Flavobacterium psychroterrae TaxID=2133767 RepID=A0ABS5PL05_9FLAO|nr:hypothetical protein [Flavobacterium psychroterrae]MBS7234126.1 hypothetical protein [Flavobacterium psychroterrae]
MGTSEINLTVSELKNTPLFLRRIFYNELTSWEEERKNFHFDNFSQSSIITARYPKREISKTINHKIFVLNEK